MDFNEELQDLINKANQNGYDFKNGKFERTKELKFPVMEEFLIDNSTDESTGYWKIFKKTVRISEEDYKTIVDYAKKHDSEDICCNCSIDIDEEFLEKIIDNIDKYDECISNGINVLYFTYELNKIPNNCFHELILTEEKLKEKITNLIN